MNAVKAEPGLSFRRHVQPTLATAQEFLVQAQYQQGAARHRLIQAFVQCIDVVLNSDHGLDCRSESEIRIVVAETLLRETRAYDYVAEVLSKGLQELPADAQWSDLRVRMALQQVELTALTSPSRAYESIKRVHADVSYLKVSRPDLWCAHALTALRLFPDSPIALENMQWLCHSDEPVLPVRSISIILYSFVHLKKARTDEAAALLDIISQTPQLAWICSPPNPHDQNAQGRVPELAVMYAVCRILLLLSRGGGLNNANDPTSSSHLERALQGLNASKAFLDSVRSSIGMSPLYEDFYLVASYDSSLPLLKVRWIDQTFSFVLTNVVSGLGYWSLSRPELASELLTSLFSINAPPNSAMSDALQLAHMIHILVAIGFNDLSTARDEILQFNKTWSPRNSSAANFEQYAVGLLFQASWSKSQAKSQFLTVASPTLDMLKSMKQKGASQTQIHEFLNQPSTELAAFAALHYLAIAQASSDQASQQQIREFQDFADEYSSVVPNYLYQRAWRLILRPVVSGIEPDQQTAQSLILSLKAQAPTILDVVSGYTVLTSRVSAMIPINSRVQIAQTCLAKARALCSEVWTLLLGTELEKLYRAREEQLLAEQQKSANEEVRQRIRQAFQKRAP